MGIQTEASLRYIEAMRDELQGLIEVRRTNGTFAEADAHTAAANRLDALGTDALGIAVAALIEHAMAEVHRRGAMIEQRDEDHRSRRSEIDLAHHTLDQLGVRRCPVSGAEDDLIAYDPLAVRIQALSEMRRA